jgi:sec-independent protein translocase protein TatA
VPNVGPMEILVVLIIALVVFGPKRLPELGKSLGKGINEFRGSVSGEAPERPAPVAVKQAPVAAVAHGPVTEAEATKTRA